jgi:RNA polymerase sigma-70 factor, ECF subfamily
MSVTCTTRQLYTIAAKQAPDTSDAALIQSIAAGDRGAMRILFARHNVRVFRFLLRFVGDESAAEDLVSEVFLDVWRQADRFQARSQVSTWLLAIARNKALSARRRRSTEELDEDAAAAIEDPRHNQR